MDRQFRLFRRAVQLCPVRSAMDADAGGHPCMGVAAHDALPRPCARRRDDLPPCLRLFAVHDVLRQVK